MPVTILKKSAPAQTPAADTAPELVMLGDEKLTKEWNTLLDQCIPKNLVGSGRPERLEPSQPGTA